MGGWSLVFRAGGYLCALDIEQVVEIMRPLPVEPLAGAAGYVTGISVIRGEPVPVVDAATLVGGAQKATRYVTVRGGPGLLALAVESVLGVRPTPARERQEPSPLLASGLVGGLGVLGTEPVLFLCTTRILPEAARPAGSPEATPEPALTRLADRGPDAALNRLADREPDLASR